MRESQTISWIFLAIAMASQVEPANYNEISIIADGINHSVPTQKMLQSSIKWLTTKGFVSKEGSKYFLTEIGKNVIKISSAKSTFLLDQWKNLENELGGLL